MAIIPNNQQIRTIDASVDMTERGSKLINDKSQVYTMADFVETIGGGALPILETYPTTDATKVGQNFIYKSLIWRYLSESEINAFGFSGKIDVGFPVPYQKYLFSESVDISGGREIGLDIIPFCYETLKTSTSIASGLSISSFNIRRLYAGPILNLEPLTTLTIPFKVFQFGSSEIVKVIGTENYTYLEDVGTSISLNLSNNRLSTENIDYLFTQLPSTTKTATIDVSSNPGSATCDPTIATVKGYTVVTS